MPRPVFKPVLKRARIGTPGFSADTMLRFGNLLNNSIRDRFNAALDIYDNAAKPLSEGYAKYKQKGSFSGKRQFAPGEPIRNLRLTGQLQRSMKVLSASQNRTRLGFSDPVSDNRMTLNQRRSNMYGVSPKDEQVLMKTVREYLFQVVKITEESA